MSEKKKQTNDYESKDIEHNSNVKNILLTLKNIFYDILKTNDEFKKISKSKIDIINEINERIISTSFSKNFELISVLEKIKDNKNVDNDCELNFSKNCISNSELAVENILKNLAISSENSELITKEFIEKIKKNKKWLLDSFVVNSDNSELFIVEFKLNNTVQKSIFDIVRSVALMIKLKINKTFIVYFKKPEIIGNQFENINEINEKYNYHYLELTENNDEENENSNKKLSNLLIWFINGKFVNDNKKTIDTQIKELLKSELTNKRKHKNGFVVNILEIENKIDHHKTSSIKSSQDKINTIPIDNYRLDILIICFLFLNDISFKNFVDKNKDIDFNFEKLKKNFLKLRKNNDLFFLNDFEKIKNGKKKNKVWNNIFKEYVMENIFLFTFKENRNNLNNRHFEKMNINLIKSIIEFCESDKFKSFFCKDTDDINDLINKNKCDTKQPYASISDNILTFQEDLVALVKNHSDKNIFSVSRDNNQQTFKKNDLTWLNSEDGITSIHVNSRYKKVLLAFVRRMFIKSEFKINNLDFINNENNEDCQNTEYIFEKDICNIDLENFNYVLDDDNDNTNSATKNNNDKTTCYEKEFLYKLIYILYFYAKINLLNLELFKEIDEETFDFWKNIIDTNMFLEHSIKQRKQFHLWEMFGENSKKTINYCYHFEKNY